MDQKDPTSLTITAQDAMAVLQANPLAMEQAKVVALQRIQAANAMTIRQQVEVVKKLTGALSATETDQLPTTLEEAETFLASVKSAENSRSPETAPAG